MQPISYFNLPQKTEKTLLNKIKNTAKYAVIVPFTLSVIACNGGYKKILDNKNVQIFTNSDSSNIILKIEQNKTKYEYRFSGPSLDDLLDLNPGNLELVRYMRNPSRTGSTVKSKNHGHNADEAFLNENEEKGRKLLDRHFPDILKYLKK